MLVIRNECCNCASPGYPCMEASCFLRRYPVFICDKCNEEVETLYKLNDLQLCDECVLEELEVVDAYE